MTEIEQSISQHKSTRAFEKLPFQTPYHWQAMQIQNVHDIDEEYYAYALPWMEFAGWKEIGFMLRIVFKSKMLMFHLKSKRLVSLSNIQC